MMDRTANLRVGGMVLALAVVLALVWATSGVAHADEQEQPRTTFHVTGEFDTVTNEDGDPIEITKITTTVEIDFGDILLPAGIDPSSITVTVDGVPLDFTKHVFTFNHQRLSVTMEEWQLKGAVTLSQLQQMLDEIKSGNVKVSYVQPADTGDERLRSASGRDVGNFEVTATSTSKERAYESFVQPDEPKTVTAIIRGNASPAKSQTVALEPVTARDTGTSAPTGQNLTNIVRRICEELGGSDCS